jgi:hypothetical protein
MYQEGNIQYLSVYQEAYQLLMLSMCISQFISTTQAIIDNIKTTSQIN